MLTQASRTLAATAVLAAAACGCGSDDANDAGGATTKATKAANGSGSATSSLVGSYGRRLTRADIERTDRLRKEGPNQEKPGPGPQELTFSEGTLKLISPHPQVTILQDFSATSDGALRIGAYQRPDKGSFCGPDVPQTASYTWSLDGDVLTLKAKEDECADRDSILSGSWKRR
jgi:hypothetical protein